MAAQLVLQLAALVPVDPAEHLRVVARRTAERDAMRPVLGQAVLARCRLQPGRADLNAHRDVRLGVLRVVAPQRRQRLLHAALACQTNGRTDMVSGVIGGFRGVTTKPDRYITGTEMRLRFVSEHVIGN